MSLQISERTTNYTHSTDDIVFHKNNNHDYVSHRTENTKYFQSNEEVDHVIHYLVVEKGYLMDSDRNGLIVFSHSHNDRFNFTFYEYDTVNGCMTKVSERLIEYL